MQLVVLWSQSIAALFTQIKQSQWTWKASTSIGISVSLTLFFIVPTIPYHTTPSYTRVPFPCTVTLTLTTLVPITSPISYQSAKCAMALPPSPGIDTKFTRARLKEIAAWIRDDLDRIVARHGPDSLRPDDVLALHDIFVAFRLSSTITAMDLRSSGIHNAVKMISDGLTRWPTRLRNECDKIVSTWTAKFGDFGELHPFLHGRGGRLEGIGNSTEFSRQVMNLQ